MARDYKDRVSPRQKQRAAPAWVWMLAGLLLGGLVVGLLWLKMGGGDSGSGWVSAPPDRLPREARTAPLPAAPASQTGIKLPPRPTSQFDFFHDLRKSEVVVPDKQLALRKNRMADASARFEIQIATFNRQAAAERLRAKLGLLGIETHLGSVRISSGDLAYRVLSGPYVGGSQLEQARRQLYSHGYRKVLVRVLR